MTEKEIQNNILRWLSTQYRIGRFWETDSGLAFYEDARGGRRAVKFGLKGQADISGLAIGGVRVEIECKTETGKQTKEQVSFGKMIVRFGGLYIVARSVDDVRQAFIERNIL
jgi:predicted porin